MIIPAPAHAVQSCRDLFCQCAFSLSAYKRTNMTAPCLFEGFFGFCFIICTRYVDAAYFTSIELKIFIDFFIFTFNT